MKIEKIKENVNRCTVKFPSGSLGSLMLLRCIVPIRKLASRCKSGAVHEQRNSRFERTAIDKKIRRRLRAA